MSSTKNIFEKSLKDKKIDKDSVTRENIGDLVSFVIEEDTKVYNKELMELIREEERINNRIKAKYSNLQRRYRDLFSNIDAYLKDSKDYDNYVGKLKRLKFRYLDTSDLVEETLEVSLVEALNDNDFDLQIEFLIKDTIIKILRQDYITSLRVENLIYRVIYKVLELCEIYPFKRDVVLLSTIKGAYEAISYSIKRFKKIINMQLFDDNSVDYENMIKSIDNSHNLFVSVIEGFINNEEIDKDTRESLKKALSNSNLKVEHMLSLSKDTFEDIKGKVYDSFSLNQAKVHYDEDVLSRIKSKIKAYSAKDMVDKDKISKIISNIIKK